MDLQSEFWKLVGEAKRRDAEASRILTGDDSDVTVDSNRMVEPVYAAIVRLVQGHPEAREEFVRCFSELVLWKREAPWMLVPFCMRALRFPEIQQLLHDDMDAHRGTAYYARRMNYCSSVMHAYNDNVWEDAIAFDYFSHELNGS